MKLAEALLIRSEHQKKIENLRQRILVNVKVQENERPHENPSELLKELFTVSGQMKELIKKINMRNCETELPNGQTLAEALVDREILMKNRSVLQAIASKINEQDYRLTHTEIKMCATMDVASIQKQIDDLSKQYRELDTMIQSVNWTVDME